MKLFPQDLGQKRGQALLLRRAGLPPPSLSETPLRDEPAQIGFWGRRWLGKRQGQATDDEALCALRALRYRLRAWASLSVLPASCMLGMLLSGADHPLPGSAFPLMAGVSFTAYFCLVGRPRALLTGHLRKMREQPLSASEIAFLLPLANDELERSYITLVMEVSRQDVSSQAGSGAESGARADLREALQALGDAIDRLPLGRTVGSERPDIMTEVLRRTAEETLLAAQAEPDRVVASSLMRQVEALHRRADATTRANTLVRRFSALRQEMAAETEALRAGLAAYYTGAGDVTDLTRLVQSVRQVAREAASVTAAVEEVDALTDETLSPVTPAWTPRRPAAAETTEPNQIRLGH